MTHRLHAAESAILYILRRSEAIRYSDLLHGTGTDSDTFKFHLRKLIKIGYIERMVPGGYRLTLVGKEFANNLDKATQTIQKQPKLSLFLVVSQQNNGTTEFLLQKRFRSPFYNYWGCLSGPAKWGEEFEETARAELRKQTGLFATFTVKTFLRFMDYTEDSATLLEDKLFVVLHATDSTGNLSNTWSGGYNEWMTLDKLKEQACYFTVTEDILTNLRSCGIYSSQKHAYTPVQY